MKLAKHVIVVTRDFPTVPIEDSIISGNWNLAKRIDNKAIEILDNKENANKDDWIIVTSKVYAEVIDTESTDIIYDNGSDDWRINDNKITKGGNIMENISVERLNLVSHKSTKAFADLNFHGLTIKGFRVVDGSNGLFISEPTQLNQKDGKFYKTVFTNNDTLKNSINEIIMEEYNKS